MPVFELKKISQQINANKDDIFFFKEIGNYHIFQKSEEIIEKTSIFYERDEIVLKLSFKECGIHNIMFQNKFTQVIYSVTFIVKEREENCNCLVS